MKTYFDRSDDQVGHDLSEIDGQSVGPRLFSSQNASANLRASGESGAPYGRWFPSLVNDLRNSVIAAVKVLGSLSGETSENPSSKYRFEMFFDCNLDIGPWNYEKFICKRRV